MNQLLATYGFNFHKNAVGIRITFILADGKRLPTLGRALMNDVKFRGRILFEEIAEYEFSLRLAVGLHVIVDGYVDGLIQEFGQFLSASCFDSFLYLGDHICLCKSDRKGRNRHRKNQKKAKNSLLHDGFYSG